MSAAASAIAVFSFHYLEPIQRRLGGWSGGDDPQRAFVDYRLDGRAFRGGKRDHSRPNRRICGLIQEMIAPVAVIYRCAE